MAVFHALSPHDPLPERGRFLLVMRRFGEDAPGITLVELVASDGSGAPPTLTVPHTPDGRPMGLGAAISHARALAEREHYDTVYAIDRTAGPRERDVLAHHGNRTAEGEALADTDPEDGEVGPDMRDIRPV